MHITNVNNVEKAQALYNVYSEVMILMGVNQKCISDIFGEMEIYIKCKLVVSSFYWQKYCHPPLYNFFIINN